jgi:hypothetical protein
VNRRAAVWKVRQRIDLCVPAVELRNRVDLLLPEETLLDECNGLAVYGPSCEGRPVDGPVDGVGLAPGYPRRDRGRPDYEGLLTRRHLPAATIETVELRRLGDLSVRVAELLGADIDGVRETGGERPGIVGSAAEGDERGRARDCRTSEVDALAGDVDVYVHEERRHRVADLRSADLERVAGGRLPTGHEERIGRRSPEPEVGEHSTTR